MRRWYGWLIVGAVAALAAAGAGADGTGTQKKKETQGRQRFEGRIEVRAAPIEGETRLDDLAGRVDVVEGDQIEALDAQDITTALRRLPGVTVSRYDVIGGYGGADGGAVFVRGHGAGRPGAEITTAVDGIPRFVGVWTHPLVDTLSLDLATRIEVFKSPQPVRYGNMAFGVADMIPRRGRGPASGELRFASGSDATTIGVAEAQGSWDGGDVLAVLSHRQSDGHRPRSAGRVDAGFLNLGVDVGRRWELRLLVSGTDAWAEDPGAEGAPAPPIVPRFEDRDVLSIVSLGRPVGADGELKIRGYWESGNIDWRQWDGRAGESFTSATDWDNRGLRLSLDLRRGEETTLSVGVDHDLYGGAFAESRPAGEGPVTDLTFRSTSVWALVRHDHGGPLRLTPSIGVRLTDTRYFGSQWGAQAGLEATVGTTTLYANAARAFNLPGVYAAVLYTAWNRPGQWQDLDAERLGHWEIGAMGRAGDAVRWSLSLFRDRVTDAIRFVPPPPFPPSFANVGAYTVRGTEATVAVQASDELALFAGATVMDTDPERVPETPETTWSAGLTWRPAPALTVALDAESVSRRWVLGTRFPSPQVELDAFVLLNGTVRLRLPAAGPVRRAEVYLAAENLGDEEYAYRPGYPMPGRSFMVGLTVGL